MEQASPKNIPHYHPGDMLGSGFAGEVYHAWDSGLEHRSEVKCRIYLMTSLAFFPLVM